MGLHGVPEVSLRIHGVPQGSRGFCRQSAVRIMTVPPGVSACSTSAVRALDGGDSAGDSS
jgi:hypothetical protein